MRCGFRAAIGSAGRTTKGKYHDAKVARTRCGKGAEYSNRNRITTNRRVLRNLGGEQCLCYRSCWQVCSTAPRTRRSTTRIFGLRMGLSVRVRRAFCGSTKGRSASRAACRKRPQIQVTCIARNRRIAAVLSFRCVSMNDVLPENLMLWGSYSVRPGRVMSSRMASRGLRSLWRIAAICSVMGISTP